jgi:hypothetical protein
MNCVRYDLILKLLFMLVRHTITITKLKPSSVNFFVYYIIPSLELYNIPKSHTGRFQLLTLWDRVLPENLIQWNPPSFMESEGSLPNSQCSGLELHLNSFHTITTCFFKISFNIDLSFWVFQHFLPLMFSHNNFLCISHLSLSSLILYSVILSS